MSHSEQLTWYEGGGMVEENGGEYMLIAVSY